MRVRKKLSYVHHFAPLMSEWECDFILRMAEGMSGTDENMHDEAIKDYLSDGQIQKIKEIFSTYIGKRTAEQVREAMENLLHHKRPQRLPSKTVMSLY